MAGKRLTAAGIETYRPDPSGKIREIKDTTEALSLLVHPSGAKSWSMRFRRPNGKSGQLILGKYDVGRELSGDPVIGQPLSIAAARALAINILRDRARGIDVIAENNARKDRMRTQAKVDAENTYASLARIYLDEHVKPKTRQWRETATNLGFRFDANEAARDVSNETEPARLARIWPAAPRGLGERWADKPIRTIDYSLIKGVINEARKSGVPGTTPRTKGPSSARGRAMHATLSAMFSWLASDEEKEQHIAASPLAGKKNAKAPQKRTRKLSPQELKWFWAATAEADAPKIKNAPRPFGSVLRLLILTGARLGEVAGMRRSEIDGATWTLPPHRVKNKREHTVTLATQARKLIPQGDSDLIWTTNGGRSAISGWSTMKARLDAAMLRIAREERGASFQIEDWRLHDLRRTFASGLQSLGIPVAVTEQCLNHVSESFGGIVGVYQQHSYAAECAEAWQRWADHLTNMVEGNTANVVPIRKKAARS
jgi:integrase